MLLLKRLQETVAAWEEGVQKRLHARAELALCDPESAERRRLLTITKAHPKFDEVYVKQLAALEPLRDHEECHDKLAFRSLGTQEQVHLALALDCEMVGTTSDDMALARVSVVDVRGRTVMDEFVLPCEPSFIVDCRTPITGLSKKDLVEKGLSLTEARRRFAKLCCADTVLLGHALDHDLLALQFRHDLVIDTSMLYPVLGPCMKEATFDRLHSLDHLTAIVLGRDMDRAKRGGVHDSVEDSCNSLDLVKYFCVALDQTKLDSAPPLPPRARRYRQRGPQFGFAALLKGRQMFANAGNAKTLLGKDEAHRQESEIFYSVQLVASARLHGSSQTQNSSSSETRLLSSSSSSKLRRGRDSAPSVSARAGTAATTMLFQPDLTSQESAKRKREAKERMGKLMQRAGGKKRRGNPIFG